MVLAGAAATTEAFREPALPAYRAGGLKANEVFPRACACVVSCLSRMRLNGARPVLRGGGGSNATS